MGKLLDQLNEWIKDDECMALSAHLNDDAHKIRRAFQGAYPMLLQGMLQAGPSVRNEVQAWVNQIADDTPETEPVSAAFLRGESSLTVRSGQALLRLIYPHQQTALINILCNYSGLAPEHGERVLNLACAALTDYIRRENLPQGAFFKWLSPQQAELEAALPPAYVSMTATEEIMPGSDTGKNRMMPVLLLCLLGIGIWYWVKGCQVENAQVAHPSAIQSDSTAEAAPEPAP